MVKVEKKLKFSYHATFRDFFRSEILTAFPTWGQECVLARPVTVTDSSSVDPSPSDSRKNFFFPIPED